MTSYRLQDLRPPLEYLKKLGITTLYAAPVTLSQSDHGYDVVDYSHFRVQLGKLLQQTHQLGLGWLQDIVPNHMYYHNVYLHDIFRKGPGSPYHGFFDIDWHDGQVDAPFLGEKSYDNVRIDHDGEFCIRYFEHRFPLSQESVDYICSLKKARREFLSYLNDHHKAEILGMQYYRLCHWKSKPNYRRFFSVNELIALNTERQEVFDEVHSHLFKFPVDAVRVDHIDGLYDPKQYMRRLAKTCPDIVVEKITAPAESCSWQTTGYEFCNRMTWLFTEPSSREAFDAVYSGISGMSYSKTIEESKRLVIRRYFMGDFERVARRFSEFMDHPVNEIRDALIEVVVRMRKYRYYELADPELLSLLSGSAILREMRGLLKEKRAEHCFMKLAQYTGAVMAKGFEDTTLYRYNRMLAHNEVGGDPVVWSNSVAEFHSFMGKRVSMNATATHDTKRGEDVRMRLCALSEFPGEWRSFLKGRLNGLPITRNDAYLIYQTFIGAYPFQDDGFRERLKAYTIKALREEKRKTCWLKPDEGYEQRALGFVDWLFSKSFMHDVSSILRKVCFFGVYNSLSQVLLKLLCPGRPDIYQGCELWDFNLVDPDNRRPVDYGLRRRYLRQVMGMKDPSSLLRNYEDGRIKLYLTYRALQFRNTHECIRSGSYRPLRVKGKYADCVIAFERRGEERAVVIVPRFFSRVVSEDEIPVGDCWEDTCVRLPPGAYHCILNGVAVQGDAYLKDLFVRFPWGVLG
ncbi:MAG: malto-oligosyltrehalose synthase [Nanobdellota archaeon]